MQKHIQRGKYFAEDAGFKPIIYRAYRPQTKVKAQALAKLTNIVVPIMKNLKILLASLVKL
ncbi:MAG: hypothetical protein RR657_04415 [Peptostreptococcaceae bacterium]